MKFRQMIKVPRERVCVIIGKNGEIKKRIEDKHKDKYNR